MKSQIQGCINLFNFIENSEPELPIYIIAHNGTTFDFIYLLMLIRRYKEYCLDRIIAIYNRFIYIDTLLLSRFLLPDRVLKILCITYGIPQNDTRAYGDVID